MPFRKFAYFAAALLIAAPAAAATHIDSAVRPGGDIPSHFRAVSEAPIPKGGDIPSRFTPPRASFEYVRREVTIPMRDGVRLYAVLIIPKGYSGQPGKVPIMLDRTPYSADKSTSPTAPSAKRSRSV